MNALHTDMYELTMLDSFVKSGKVNDRATFEVFTRRLPAGRRFGVFAGLGRLIPLIKSFSFLRELGGAGAMQAWTKELGLSRETYEYLVKFKFTGEIDAYMEGDLFFPHSPVMTVSGTLGECILLETLILSVLNFDSAIATTAARMVMSAKGRSLIEMGSRRTHEEAAVAAARAAYLVGFDATSNLLAGKRYGIPTKGTAAHAYTLAHDTEIEAFARQVEAQGEHTTLLVDTYNIHDGIRRAVQVAGTQLGAIRIDSGDLAYEATEARKLLDSLGAFGTKILVSSDLDELIIKDLADAPIDGYGIGTRLVASQPMGFVYKLVEIEDSRMVRPENPWANITTHETYMRPVAKKSKDKVSHGGRKYAFRIFDDNHKIVGEVFTTDPNVVPKGHFSALQWDAMIEERNLSALRAVHKENFSELPLGEQKVWNGDFGPYITCEEYK